jgi:hypothetical protein
MTNLILNRLAAAGSAIVGFRLSLVPGMDSTTMI